MSMSEQQEQQQQQTTHMTTAMTSPYTTGALAAADAAVAADGDSGSRHSSNSNSSGGGVCRLATPLTLATRTSARKPQISLQPEALLMPADDTTTSSSCACSDSAQSLSQRVDEVRTPSQPRSHTTRHTALRDRGAIAPYPSSSSPSSSGFSSPQQQQQQQHLRQQQQPQPTQPRSATMHTRMRRGDATALSPDKLNSPRNATNTNLFIRNLAPQVDQTMLNRLFADYGTILSSAIMRNIHTGVSLGTGFVRYETHEQARAAIEQLCGQQFEGRVISVQWANKHEGAPVGEARQKIRKLFVRNIPVSVSVDDLKDFFSRYGDVKDVTIHKDTTAAPDRALERRIAFVIYVKEGVADKAAAAVHNTTPFAACQGIPLMVKLAEDSYNKYERRNALAVQGRRANAATTATTTAVTATVAGYGGGNMFMSATPTAVAAMLHGGAAVHGVMTMSNNNNSNVCGSAGDDGVGGSHNTAHGRSRCAPPYTCNDDVVVAVDMAADGVASTDANINNNGNNGNGNNGDYCTPSCQTYYFSRGARSHAYYSHGSDDSGRSNSSNNNSRSASRHGAVALSAYHAATPTVVHNAATANGGYRHVRVPCYAHTPQAMHASQHAQQQQQPPPQQPHDACYDSCDHADSQPYGYRYYEYHDPLPYTHNGLEYTQLPHEQQQQQQQQPMSASATPLSCVPTGFLYATPSAFDMAAAAAAADAAGMANEGMSCDDGSAIACMQPPTPVLSAQHELQQPQPQPQPHAPPSQYVMGDGSVGYYTSEQSDYGASYYQHNDNGSYRHGQPPPPTQAPSSYSQPVSYVYSAPVDAAGCMCCNNNNNNNNNSHHKNNNNSHSHVSRECTSYSLGGSNVSYAPTLTHASYAYSGEHDCNNNNSNNSHAASAVVVMPVDGDEYMCACCSHVYGDVVHEVQNGTYVTPATTTTSVAANEDADASGDVLRPTTTTTTTPADATATTHISEYGYTSGQASPSMSLASHTRASQHRQKSHNNNSSSSKGGATTVVVTTAAQHSAAVAPASGGAGGHAPANARARSYRSSPRCYATTVDANDNNNNNYDNNNDDNDATASSLVRQQQRQHSSSSSSMTSTHAAQGMAAAAQPPQPLWSSPSPPLTCYMYDTPRDSATLPSVCDATESPLLPPAAVHAHSAPQQQQQRQQPRQASSDATQMQTPSSTPGTHPQQYRNNPYSMTAAIISH